jgi:hypothetical protein
MIDLLYSHPASIAPTQLLELTELIVGTVVAVVAAIVRAIELHRIRTGKQKP